MEALSSLTSLSYLAAFKKTYDVILSFSHPIIFQRMDNEFSADLDAYFKTKYIIVQFVPPNNHRSSGCQPKAVSQRL
jgi:hypothetical protein